MRKRYLDEQPGAVLGDVWTDISQIRGADAELLGYPTQKPLALLERIIQASSNPGDVVLDPFAGCGTTVAAAQKLGRRWIGIDITYLSILLLKLRLKDMFGNDAHYEVDGLPTSLQDAKALAANDRYQFQYWALTLVGAWPYGAQQGSRTGKKGADRGIDGVITFFDDTSGRAKRMIVQVKSGNVDAGDVRNLSGTMRAEGAVMGLFITLAKPTRPMLDAAFAEGRYTPGLQFTTGMGKQTEQRIESYPSIQILTIEELLHGAKPKMPPHLDTHKQAQRVQQSALGERMELVELNPDDKL